MLTKVQVNLRNTTQVGIGPFAKLKRNMVDQFKFGSRFTVQQGLFKILESHGSPTEVEQMQKLFDYETRINSETMTSKGSLKLNQI